MDEIFVFGSNLAGRHGAGAALYARHHHGAVYGQGVGLQGQSYAIPTKNNILQPLSLTEIREHVNAFLRFASDNPNLKFRVTAIGTGHAGYKHSDIAPMFADAPPNCDLPDEWTVVLGSVNADS